MKHCSTALILLFWPTGLADEVIMYLHSNGNRIIFGGQVNKVYCSGADTVVGEFLVDDDMWALSCQTDGNRCLCICN